jgi:hypothetical protein
MKLLRFIKLLLSDIGCALKEHLWAFGVLVGTVTCMGIFWVIGAIANLVSSDYSEWVLAQDHGHINSFIMYTVGGATITMFLVMLALIPLFIYVIYAIYVKIKEYWNKA